MQLFVVGINHRSAELAIRERYAIAFERTPEFLAGVTQRPHVEEGMLLSTCNRVEFYGVSKHPLQAKQQVIEFLAQFQNADPAEVETYAYHHVGEEAVRHGFRVASSLDSMILGESQILGQVKDAYRQALESESTGRLLNKFFHHVFYAAKRVRTETAIAAHPVSVSYAAVVLAKQIFGDLKDKKVLLLGAGETSRLALKHLKGAGVQTFYIANRTPSRAEELAEEFGGEAIPFSNFQKWLGDVDVVLTSTNAPNYLVDGAMVHEAFQQRKSSPMFLIDLAVPRDISPEVNELRNVFLYDVDDLGTVVEANREARVQESERALNLIEKEVEEFCKILRGFEVVPTISSLTKKMEKICRHEIEKTLQRLPQLDGEGRAAVENMAEAIIKKILHDPMITLKEDHGKSDGTDSVQLVRRLFRLDEV